MVNATPQLEGLGETLIPAINRLQDIFSQVNAVESSTSLTPLHLHQDELHVTGPACEMCMSKLASQYKLLV